MAYRDERYYFSASQSANAHYELCLQLETYPLFGSQYEEAALWSLFIITATADPALWKESTFDVLRKCTFDGNDEKAFTNTLQGG